MLKMKLSITLEHIHSSMVQQCSIHCQVFHRFDTAARGYTQSAGILPFLHGALLPFALLLLRFTVSIPQKYFRLKNTH